MRLPTAMILAAVVSVLLAGACGPPSGSGRSVILVTLDTTRADRIGAYGGDRVDTPRLDAIAADGALFENAISQAPLTLPAHSSILTARYPASHGVRHNGIYRLPPEVRSLAEHLAEGGYDTAAFIGAYVLNRGFGTEQGFGVYDDIAVDRFAGGRDQIFRAERSADRVNEAVFSWLDERDTGPFFLWVHYYDPHDPYEPPETEGRTLQGEGYDREISYVDACFGDLVDRLRAEGLLDDSVLVVVGDHGESLHEHEEKTHGIFLYEGAMRVPMFLRAPGLVPAGTRVPGPVELVDIAPTVLDLLEFPPLPAAEGETLVRRLDGSVNSLQDVAYAETLMSRLEFGWSSLFMLRDMRFKYIEAPRPELYDLALDPAESLNLVAEQPQRAAEMAAMLREWKDRTSSVEASGNAAQTLSAEEIERLQGLGYLSGGTSAAELSAGDESDKARPDPKDKIGEVRRLGKARELLDGEEAQGALDLCLGILKDNPHNHQARATKIRALIQLDRLKEAEEEARAGLSLIRTDAEAGEVLEERAISLLASTMRLQGENREAEALYREILAVNPGNRIVPVDLAGLLIETGRASEALSLMQDHLERNPRDGLGLAVRFLAELELGRDEDALASAAGLAEARAGDTRALVKAGDLLLEADRPAEAARCFEAAQESKDLSPAILARLGKAQLAAGDLDRATLTYRALTRLAPRDPRPFAALGEIALQRGNEAEARAAAEQALRRNPANPEALRLMEKLNRGG